MRMPIPEKPMTITLPDSQNYRVAETDGANFIRSARATSSVGLAQASSGVCVQLTARRDCLGKVLNEDLGNAREALLPSD